VTVPGRALRTCAIGFFLLDAVLLVWAGLEQRRTGLLVGGFVCAAAAAVVVLLWRRYRRVLAEVETGRREMVEQAESIRRLLNESHQKN
jgi:Flp pilus assembly protein protease CpaA